MLREEDVAFSEDEVGGAWPQPQSATHAQQHHSHHSRNTHNNSSAAAASSAVSRHGTRADAPANTAASIAAEVDSGALLTSSRGKNTDHNRKAAAAPAPAAVPSSSLQAASSSNSSSVSFENVIANVTREEKQNTKEKDVPHPLPAVRAVNLDDVHLSCGDDVSCHRSQSSHMRSLDNSRGPPPAAVMDAPLPGQVAALVSVTTPFARPASQDSINFSIASSSSRRSSRGDELMQGQEDNNNDVDDDDNEVERLTPDPTLSTVRDFPWQLTPPPPPADHSAASGAAANIVAQSLLLSGPDGQPRRGDDDGDDGIVGVVGVHAQDEMDGDCGSPLPSSLTPVGDAANASTNASESIHSSSPPAVTLWGVHNDLRRKRIKKVSHYILGSLLGEGTYGVVRDCIDINTDNVNRRFQRCAIKIVNGSYAKADMPALFGSRGLAGSEGDKEAALRGSPNGAASGMPGTLKRTTGGGGGGGGNGMRYHREDEMKRYEVFQREMRNLQRFHCKNIVRALDSFTRYSKEYVVMPIAICSVQQLVRQLMRTRWKEAVREWRRQQRKAAGRRQHQQTQSSQRGGTLPMVPSTVDTLDLDDLTFMEDDEEEEDDTYMNSDYDSVDEEDDDDDDKHDDGVTPATNAANSTGGNGDAPQHQQQQQASLTSVATAAQAASQDAEDRQSSESLSDRDDDDNKGSGRVSHSYARPSVSRSSKGAATLHAPTSYAAADHSANNNDGEGGRGAHCAGQHSSQRRRIPRVPSHDSDSHSTTTTTTTTARTIDSYDNGINIGSSSNSPSKRDVSSRQGRSASARGQALGGEDESSDLSSCNNNNNNNNNTRSGAGGDDGSPQQKILVMSATPRMSDVDAIGGGQMPSLHNNTNDDDSTSASNTLSPAHHRNSQGVDVRHDDTRPHLSFPMCSTTLLKGIFYQVMSGVHYLHQQGLAHNDIKPSNILLFEDGTVKLGDLGSVSDTYNDQGTPLCASPELCKYFYGAATPPSSFSQSTEQVGRDAALPSDLWCCGLLLYYLITGKPGPLPVQLRYFQSLHSKHHHHRSDIGRHHAQQQRTPGPQGGKEGRGGAAACTRDVCVPPPVVTRYQLYREIASQTAPVDLSDLPDMVAPDMGDDDSFSADLENSTEGAAAAATYPSAAQRYPRNSVRHLLAGLLELDPQRRLTAKDALQHPWLRMTFRSKPNERDDAHVRGGKGTTNSSSNNTNNRSSSPKNTGGAGEASTLPVSASHHRGSHSQRKPPSRQAMEDAIQRDVARRVTESRHVQRMLKLDRQRHLQFVADCCNMLNLAIPAEIIKVQPAEPYREDIDALIQSKHQRALTAAAVSSASLALGSNATPQERNAAAAAAMAAAMVGGGRNATRAQAIVLANHLRQNVNIDYSTANCPMRPAVMPPGCVDTELFLPYTEEDYYEQKSGKSEFDVRVLRRKPLLMAQLDEYFHNVVLVQCGYRTGPDPNYQAMRVRAVPPEDELGSRRRPGSSSSGSGGGSRVVTQQPSVVILPGAGTNAYRRSPSVGVAVEAVNAATETATAQATAGLVEDVWGAGPRHQPRVHVDENGNVTTLTAVPVAGQPVVVVVGHTNNSSSSRGAGGGASPDFAMAGNAASMARHGGVIISVNAGGSGSRTPLAPPATASSTSSNSTTRPSYNTGKDAAAQGGSTGAASGGRGGGTRPGSVAVSVTSSGNATRSSGTGGRRVSGDSVGHSEPAEVMGTAVGNTTRASGQSNSGSRRGNMMRGGGSANGTNTNGNARSPRDRSESPSDGEHNVAMRESSKCLCGLM